MIDSKADWKEGRETGRQTDGKISGQTGDPPRCTVIDLPVSFINFGDWTKELVLSFTRVSLVSKLYTAKESGLVFIAPSLLLVCPVVAQ